jgi:GNAT superfamily N-acetyltransferase
MKFREATIEDWEKLAVFYNRIYRKSHPLQNKTFWEWQYGDPKYGRAFICLDENDKIIGHVGGNFCDGISWMINGYLDEEYRGRGVMSNLYDLARKYYPLAATAANNLGLGMYHSMGWVRYYDLVRYVKINPAIQEVSVENVCKKITVSIEDLIINETHYFQQPSIKGIRLSDGSTAVSQEETGGLRLVSIEDLKQLESQAWEKGYLWMDYITSWNDPFNKQLERNGWVLDFKSVVPWRLNPLIEGYFCDITFLSEEPIDKKIIVRRSYSDHGRIGSL